MKLRVKKPTIISASIQIALSALLAVCFYDPPYGYYQFIRIVCCIGFLYLSYVKYESIEVFNEDYKSFDPLFFILYFLFAIAMNPIYKVSFKRELWLDFDRLFIIVTILDLIVELLFYLYNRFIKNKDY